MRQIQLDREDGIEIPSFLQVHTKSNQADLRFMVWEEKGKRGRHARVIGVQVQYNRRRDTIPRLPVC